MRVLGIDPGSEILGWGVVEGTGSKYSLVDFGTVRSSPRVAFSKRILKVYEGVSEVISQAAPTLCIQVPMLDVIAAIQILGVAERPSPGHCRSRRPPRRRPATRVPREDRAPRGSARPPRRGWSTFARRACLPRLPCSLLLPSSRSPYRRCSSRISTWWSARFWRFAR